MGQMSQCVAGRIQGEEHRITSVKFCKDAKPGSKS